MNAGYLRDKSQLLYYLERESTPLAAFNAWLLFNEHYWILLLSAIEPECRANLRPALCGLFFAKRSRNAAHSRPSFHRLLQSHNMSVIRPSIDVFANERKNQFLYFQAMLAPTVI